MVMNHMNIIQSGNTFYLYTETNLCLGGVVLPNNGQHLYDLRTLELITKALAIRWGVINPPKKH